MPAPTCIVMIARLGKIIVLGTADAIGVWAAVGLFSSRSWAPLTCLLAGLGVLNFVLLSKRAYPLRYILPGLIPFALMVAYPIIYNMSIAFTNYGTGNRLTKDQVIAHFENMYYLPEGSERFAYQAFRDADGNLALLLVSKDGGELYLALDEVLRPVDAGDPRFVYEGEEIVRIDGYHQLSRREVVRLLGKLQGVSLRRGEDTIRLVSLNEFAVYRRSYRYDQERDVLVDLRTGVEYTPVQGTFTSPTGETLQPGFVTWVGFQNFFDIITNPRVTGPFFRVFRWTFLWALLSVVSTFALGLGLAILLNDPYLELRHVYRTILILPYAIPGFISIMVWAGLLNVDFGVVNRILRSLVGVTIPWFHDGFWARVGVLLVNLWLGYPYMMIVSLGALQSIPQELYEAARVDGANRWQRFWKITLPLLLISVAPLLVGSFAFNFNNFNVIYLLTGGGPPIPGAQTLAGQTDILISYTYKLAFGGAGAQYGFASAISLIIFLIIGTISALNFRFTRRLEQMSEGL